MVAVPIFPIFLNRRVVLIKIFLYNNEFIVQIKLKGCKN